MTLQDKIKIIFLRRLKLEDIEFYKQLRINYDNDLNMKYLIDSLFKSFNPCFILSILYKNVPLDSGLFHKIRQDFYDILNNTNRINKRFTNINFKADTPQKKEKLYNFCSKYGIVKYNYYSQNYLLNLKGLINNNNTFHIDSNLELCLAFSSEDKSLDEIIYMFETEANKVNNIKLPFLKRVINKLKYGY